MTNEIGKRHASDLSGRLSDPGFGARITIAVSETIASFPSTQHLVWTLVNLLARQPREVRQIVLDMPSTTTLATDVSPLVDSSGPLIELFRDAAVRINPNVFQGCEDPIADVFIRIGAGGMPNADFAIAVSADQWSGYIGTAPVEISDSTNPIGAYVGASLVVGEIFKYTRKVLPEEAEFPTSLWLNAFTLELSANRTGSPNVWGETMLPPTTLAGVGAVGSAFLQSIHAFPGCRGAMAIVDGDEEGVSESNLNRYVLFDLRHIRHKKASTVAAYFRNHSVELLPFDEAWQTAREKDVLPIEGFVISAVDRNSARHAIQDAMPRKILGASTNEFRLQVNFYDTYDPTSVCLKCRNRLEAEGIPDDEIVERLRRLSDEDLADAAAATGVALENLKLFVSDPKVHCGKVSGSSLQKFAATTDDGEWSVGFVSFLAGVLLCAEYLKQIHCDDTRMSTIRNQYLFQFWRPANSRSNRLTSQPPEATCICRSAFYQRAFVRIIPSIRIRSQLNQLP